MTSNVLFSLLAALAVFPAAGLSLRSGRTDGMFRITLALAIAGPLIWIAVRSDVVWQRDFASALWITVVATTIVYALLIIMIRDSLHLKGIVLPYMALLALLAFIWETAGPGINTEITSGWLIVHILVSVTTYAVVTLAACAACAGFLQERALKSRHTTAFTQRLPSVADSTALQVRLLGIAEFILALGLISGVASSLAQGGPAFEIDHKTLFALLTFVFLGGMLVIHHKSGLRGKQIMRAILVGYLLLTLAYPGVKFVTDVIL